jgi:hypothetical protein
VRTGLAGIGPHQNAGPLCAPVGARHHRDEVALRQDAKMRTSCTTSRQPILRPIFIRETMVMIFFTPNVSRIFRHACSPWRNDLFSNLSVVALQGCDLTSHRVLDSRRPSLANIYDDPDKLHKTTARWVLAQFA